MQYTKHAVIILLMLLGYAHCKCQVTTVNSGSWASASVWSGGAVPDASDDVIIRHTITIPTSSSSYAVRSLTIENGTRNADASLSFNNHATNVRSLHILNDLTVNATSNNGCRFQVQGAFTSTAVDGNINLIRDHTGSVTSFGISLRDGASLMAANLTLNYLNSSDDAHEVRVRETSSLILSGDFLAINSGGAEEISIDAEDDAHFECNNFIAQLTTPESADGVDRDIELRISDNASMVVHGNLVLTRTGGRRINVSIGSGSTSSASVLVEGDMAIDHLDGNDDSGKDLPVTLTGEASLTVRGNLNATSTSERPLSVALFGSSFLDIDGDLSVQGSTNTNLTIRAYNTSRLFFGGDVLMDFPSSPNPSLFSFSSVTPNITTVTFNGTANQTVPGSETYGNLTIQNTDRVTLGGDITVNNALTLTSGKVLADNFVVTIPLGGSISGSSTAYICNGTVRRSLAAGGPHWFYTGDKIKGYSPVRLTDLSSDSEFTVQYFGTDPGHAPAPGPYSRYTFESGLQRVSGGEYWLIDRIAGSGSANITLGWNINSDVNGAALADLRVSHWDGTRWEYLAGATYSGDETQGLLTTTTPVTNFSPFTLASTTTANVLPLTLVSFSAEPHDNGVLLSWQTASEINNKEFTIERSADGTTFQSIGQIDARNPKSAGPHTYTWLDEAPLPCLSYYRLKQTDYDGRSETFKVIAINNPPANGISVFPNPVSLNSNSKITIQLPGCEENIKYIRIFDLQGKEKLQLKIKSHENAVITQEQLLRLGKGLYIVKAFLSYNVFTTKLSIH